MKALSNLKNIRKLGYLALVLSSLNFSETSAKEKKSLENELIKGAVYLTIAEGIQEIYRQSGGRLMTGKEERFNSKIVPSHEVLHFWYGQTAYRAGGLPLVIGTAALMEIADANSKITRLVGQTRTDWNKKEYRLTVLGGLSQYLIESSGMDKYFSISTSITPPKSIHYEFSGTTLSLDLNLNEIFNGLGKKVGSDRFIFRFYKEFNGGGDVPLAF